MAHHSGHPAGSDKEKEIREGYEEIKHLRSEIDWGFESGWAHRKFQGTWDEENEHAEELRELSGMDFLILADKGNLCFGGHCRKHLDGGYWGKFHGKFSTD